MVLNLRMKVFQILVPIVRRQSKLKDYKVTHTMILLKLIKQQDINQHQKGILGIMSKMELL